ncbi:hypothetical protein [Pseudomonas sp. zfem003]|uniref:hypothetical protein n=1 Tax=Pseudomonas sp. zfem003 TaxID=3078198 RepID=UPI002927CD65|nr:hypothetical protein [Pseudomonas sp. zfem003]MDU9400591.1 hypothetical protein [Pseudomonas sp. zfem003]
MPAEKVEQAICLQFAAYSESMQAATCWAVSTDGVNLMTAFKELKRTPRFRKEAISKRHISCQALFKKTGRFGA